MFLLIAIILILAVYTFQKNLYNKYWDKHFSVSAKFSKKCVNEGDKVILIEEVKNAKSLSLPSVTVKLATTKNFDFCSEANPNVSDKCYIKNIFSLLSYQKIERRLEFTALRRGFYEINDIDIVFTNFFCNKELTKRLLNYDSIYVFPKMISVREFPQNLNVLIGNFISRQFINEDPFEFRGIREYQPYDNFTSINWKSSAKMNKLMVNQNYSTSSLKVSLIFNTELNNEYTKLEILEHAISITSSLAKNFVDKNIVINFFSTGASEEEAKLVENFDSSCEHLFEINKILAKTQFNKQDNNCIELVENIDANNLVILISSYRKDDLCECFSSLGDNFVWIIPCEKDEKFEGNVNKIKNVVRWEMKE